MAAYAALVSLLNTMDQIQDHPRISITLQQNQIEALKETVDFLLHFIETGPPHRGNSQQKTKSLESQITSAAYAAEDVIETHALEQIQAATGSVSLLDLQTTIQDMDYVKKKVVTFKEEILIGFKDPKSSSYYPRSDDSTTSSETLVTVTARKMSTMIGFDHELYQLMDALTARYQSARQIIPIVGMGGIGKTTLAINVYENPLILHHFDIRAWATICQEYSIKDIFSDLLSRESKSVLETEYQQLALELHQMLINRRYLIVLDDMWSIEVWDRIKFFFPENNNGSRIVVTTRLSNMATHFGTPLLPLKLLNEDNSWKLFSEKAFPHEQGCCPFELEEVGRKIVKKCKGLPLLIVIIGALLRKSSRAQEYWEDISDDISSILNTKEEEIKSLDILLLSYRHLPAHLKPCFLYMGIFPEDAVIRASRLIKLWVAEGFIRSNKNQSSEDVALVYLKDLIDRNLLICRMKWNGTTKTCEMHDLLRDLCIKIAEKENFLCAIRASDILQKGVINNGRRIVFHKGTSSEQTSPNIDGSKSALQLTRSLLSNVADLRSIKFKLLRVLNVPNSLYHIDDILKQVNLRHIFIDGQLTYAQNPTGNLFSSISRLWNLQTLVIKAFGKQFDGPPEIWEMRQVRHINMYTICLPDPPPLSSNQSYDEVFVLRNLQSLKTAWDMKLSEQICKRIPHVKKLSIVYKDFSGNSSYDFARLHNLEFLKCWFYEKPNLDNLLRDLAFPSSLQKLILGGCYLRWEDLSIIGSLPHLQVLQLKTDSVTGTEWNSVEGEFVCLKFLRICCNDLVNWNAENNSFPVLEKLVLLGLRNLKEIPCRIGEIPTLGFIDLVDCSESAAVSAMEILKEQESLGYEDLQVRIRFWSDVRLRSFKEKVQHMECSTSRYLQVSQI